MSYDPLYIIHTNILPLTPSLEDDFYLNSCILSVCQLRKLSQMLIAHVNTVSEWT